MSNRKIEIMDTTLRDGEQTSGVSFSAPEKLTIAKLLLEELHVDRIEVASARVSDGEFDDTQMVEAVLKNYNGTAEERGRLQGGIRIPTAPGEPLPVTPVHTISLGSHAGSWRMKLIAEQNNGIYTVDED